MECRVQLKVHNLQRIYLCNTDLFSNIFHRFPQQSARKVELHNTKITCFLVQTATQKKVKILSNKEKVRWVLLPTAPHCLCSQTGVGEGSPADGSASVPWDSQTSGVSFGSYIHFKRKTKVVSPRALPSFHFGVR